MSNRRYDNLIEQRAQYLVSTNGKGALRDLLTPKAAIVLTGLFAFCTGLPVGFSVALALSLYYDIAIDWRRLLAFGLPGFAVAFTIAWHLYFMPLVYGVKAEIERRELVANPPQATYPIRQNAKGAERLYRFTATRDQLVEVARLAKQRVPLTVRVLRARVFAGSETAASNFQHELVAAKWAEWADPDNRRRGLAVTRLGFDELMRVLDQPPTPLAGDPEKTGFTETYRQDTSRETQETRE